MNISGGKSITIINGKVMVDGKDVTPEDAKEIHIEVTGDVDTIKVDACTDIKVSGNTGKIETHQGSIDVGGDINGNASTSQGDIEVNGNVTGNVTTSQGDIDVRGSVGGNAKTTMGDVTHR